MEGEVNWLVSDHLGTPRMIADLSGGLSGIKRHDYLPFGEEIGAGVGGRTTGQGYASSNLRQKWAKLERDGETGLDYAQARYYSNVQGRFTSVDPENAGAHEEDPQSWNGYAYVQNNPLSFVDPTGLERDECDEHYCRWVGDYDGELSTELNMFEDGTYWNAEKHQWESGAAYRSRTYDPLQEFVNEVARRTAWMEPYGEAAVDLMPVPGGASAGIVKRVGRAATVAKLGRHGFKHPWIKRALFKQLPKLVGAADAKKFKAALKKGVVGPKDEVGIKLLRTAENGYTHELKIGGSAQRLLGRINEDGILVFDKFVRGGFH